MLTSSTWIRCVRSAWRFFGDIPALCGGWRWATPACWYWGCSGATWLKILLLLETWAHLKWIRAMCFPNLIVKTRKVCASTAGSKLLGTVSGRSTYCSADGWRGAAWSSCPRFLQGGEVCVSQIKWCASITFMFKTQKVLLRAKMLIASL